MSDSVIEVKGLSKYFGNFVAVNQLNMKIEAGKVHGFLGPNGSGKTTAIRMMCGLMDKTAGEVVVLGMSVDSQATCIRDQVGYMTQRFSLYQDMTVQENLLFIAEMRGMNKKARLERVAAVLTEYDLAAFKQRLAGALSGGQKRRLALAAAVLTEPKLLILDEPTSEVDPNTRRDMWEKFFKLAAQGVTILVSTHLMDEAERCHHLTILNEGIKVADGSTRELKEGFNHHVILVDGENVAWLSEPLKGAEKVLSVAQSGLTLRVLVSAEVEDALAYIKSLLSENGAMPYPAEQRQLQSYQVQQSKPTIEDVFVVATQLNVSAAPHTAALKQVL